MSARSFVSQQAARLKRFTVTQLWDYSSTHERYVSRPTTEYWVRVLYQEGRLRIVGDAPVGKGRPARIYEVSSLDA